ncbi:MAG: MerR family transcriptional regulator [Myxococcales bacterium]|nr:MerR family transcriptional regulator [Myxococcales bacterium]
MGPRAPKPRRNFVVTAEVLKAAGVSYATLREWINKGVVPPPLEAVRGRGNLSKYPRHAVAQADLARRLRDEGWSLDEIAAHMTTRTWD